MGSLCTPAQTTSTYAPNPQATQQYQEILGRANQVASQPYQAYGGQGVAGLTPEQQAGISNVNNAYGVGQPYIDHASQYATQGASPVANLSAQDIQQYYSPYQKNVVDATMANINETNAQQQNQLRGNIGVRGALGGDRQAVLQSELARQQGLASNQTLAGLQNQGYQSALGAAQGQQQNQQTNANRAAQAAYTFAGLGGQAQNLATQGGFSQIQAGGVGQQNQQAQLDYARQQFLQQQAFPYQQTGWLAGIANPTAGALGGTQTTTPPAPSPLSQIAGLGLAGLGLSGGLGWKPFAAAGGRITGYAEGGSVSPFDFTSAPTYINDSGGYVPKIQLAAPQRHNFEATAPMQNPTAMPTIPASLRGILGPSDAGNFGGSPESNPNLMPIGASDYMGSVGGMGGGLGGMYAHGGLVHAIHAIRKGIRSRYAEGGAVEDDSLNPRNWLGWQSGDDAGNTQGGTFEPMRYAEAPPTAPPSPMARPDNIGPSPLSVAPQGAPQDSPFMGTPGGDAGMPLQAPTEGQGGGSPPNGGFLSNMSQEQRHGLLAAGLGILGGSSPYAGVNIGQGGLKGVEAMAQYRKEQLDAGLKKEAQALRQQHADVEARRLAQQAEQFAKTFGENQSQHRAQQEQRERAFNAAKVPPGFRPTAEGGMEAIPGGPHDPKVIAAAAKAKLPSGGEIPEELRNVRGQEFLDALPPGEGEFIKKVAQYEVDPKSLSTKGGHREDVFKKAIHYDDKFDQKQYNSIYNAVNKFATGKQGDTIRSFNVGIAHLDTLEGLINSLGNKDLNTYNRIANKVKTELGYEAPTNFDAARDIVGKEIIKAVVGAGGGVEERRDAAEKLSAARSPQQLMGVIKTYKDLMGGQLTGLRQQYKDATKLDNFDEKLLPETIMHLSMKKGEPATSAPPTGAVRDGYKFKGGDPSKKENWEKQ